MIMAYLLRRPRAPSPPQAPILRCLRDIAAGMTHLHSMHVVHGGEDARACGCAAMHRSDHTTLRNPCPQPSPMCLPPRHVEQGHHPVPIMSSELTAPCARRA